MGRNAAVLVIEDDHDALEAILDLLECEGYAVFGARGGDEALALLATMPTPGVIVCDVMMAGMNGAEVGAAIRSEPRLSLVPIVYFSAARGAERIVGAQVMKKPFAPETLLAILHRYVRA